MIGLLIGTHIAVGIVMYFVGANNPTKSIIAKIKAKL